MKILDIIGKIIDWLGKNLSRLKTMGMIVLLSLFIISIFKGGCQRSEIEKLVERVTGLNIQNDILHQDVKDRDSLILQKEIMIQELRDSLTLSIAREKILKTNYRRLETKYETLADSLITVPTDTSYAFLTNTAYPYEGEMKYPFNEPQVKGIHLTYLEKESLEGMNYNLLAQLKEKEFQITDISTIATAREDQMEMLFDNQTDLEKELNNKDAIIDIKDKQIKKERNRKTFWQVAGGIIVMTLTILAVGGN